MKKQAQIPSTASQVSPTKRPPSPPGQSLESLSPRRSSTTVDGRSRCAFHRTLPEAIVFAGDGQRISKWGRLLENADARSTMIASPERAGMESVRTVLVAELPVFVAFGLYCAPVPAFRTYSYLNATIGSTSEAR
jgi:hypothetical protein